MIIEQPTSLLRWLYPRAEWRMDASQRKVFLTFDDGPIPEATPFILDTLRRYDAKATFFMVGDNVRKHPEVFRQVLAEGHRVGNHTYNHLGSLRHDTEEYVENVMRADELIQSELFRPPHGWLRRSAYRTLAQRYRIIMWDLVTRDYSRRITAEGIYENVRRYARNGSIITFHDSLKSIEKLREALPRSLSWLKQQGYAFELL